MRIITGLLLLCVLAFGEMHEAEGEGYTFAQAQRYCRDLGPQWRTLRIFELFELRGDERFSKGRSFWSSDTVVTGPSKGTTGSEGDAMTHGSTHGYSFYLQDGDVTISPLEKEVGVLCTDAPVRERIGQFEQSSSGVIDRSNSILWQPLDAADKKAKYTFEKAREACELLDSGDRSWRLPTLDELYGIVSYERTAPSVDTELFGIMMSRYYWSDDVFSPTQAYVVGFKLGSVATSDKKNASYIRCVSDLEE